jgi:DNA-binding protein HU-beta
MGRITRLYKGEATKSPSRADTRGPDIGVFAETLQERRDQAKQQARGAYTTDLIERLAASGAFTSKAAAKRFVTAFIETATEGLAQGKSLKIREFCALWTVQRRGRSWESPFTGETADLPNRRGIRFSPGKRLKTAIRRPRS